MRRLILPWSTLLLNAGGIVAFQAPDYPAEPPVLGILVALYTVAVTGRRRRTVVISGMLAALVVLVVAVSGPAEPVPIVVDAFVLIVTASTLGEAVRAQRAYRAEVAERDARAAYTREQEAGRRVAGGWRNWPRPPTTASVTALPDGPDTASSAGRNGRSRSAAPCTPGRDRWAGSRSRRGCPTGR